MHRSKLVWLLVAVAATAAACATSGSFSGDAPPQPDAGSPNDPAGPAIFVSPNGSDNADGATAAAPMHTIQAGIKRATACPRAPCLVKIAAGTYLEAVTLFSGVHIYGGYTPDFTARDWQLNVVRITSSEARTVIAADLDAQTVVDGVTIAGADLSAGVDGKSSYALWVRQSQAFLVVLHATVVGGKGARGVAGASGGAGVCTATGGVGGSATDCDSAVGGDGNAGGDPESGGKGGNGGGNNCPSACPLVGTDGISDGANGKPGADGVDGPGGAPSDDAIGAFLGGEWAGKAGGFGANGTNGTGGGAGGSGGTKRIRACFGCGTLLGGRGGDGANGGCGGGGGAGGSAGGAGIAVLVIVSQPSFTDSSVTGGEGGNGGAGGEGHAGSAGETMVDNGLRGAASQRCGAITYDSGGGGHGAVGGRGGAGGGGAGGNGGPSIAIGLVGDGAKANPFGVVMIATGKGGIGGAGGASTGATGSRGKVGAALGEQAL